MFTCPLFTWSIPRPTQSFIRGRANTARHSRDGRRGRSQYESATRPAHRSVRTAGHNGGSGIGVVVVVVDVHVDVVHVRQLRNASGYAGIQKVPISRCRIRSTDSLQHAHVQGNRGTRYGLVSIGHRECVLVLCACACVSAVAEGSPPINKPRS